MTRDGLVQKNLETNSSVRISKRETRQRMVRKKGKSIQTDSITVRKNGQTRDAPDRRKNNYSKRMVRSDGRRISAGNTVSERIRARGKTVRQMTMDGFVKTNLEIDSSIPGRGQARGTPVRKRDVNFKCTEISDSRRIVAGSSASKRMRARSKTVQRMTRSGLVQDNLGDKSSVRISRREAERQLIRKHHLGKDENYAEKKGSKSLRERAGKRRLRYRNHEPENVRAESETLKENTGNQTKELHSSRKSENCRSSRGRYETKESGKQMKNEKSSGKLYQKKRMVSESRGDSRKQKNGGTKRPQNKKRLQFSYEESGASDLERNGDSKPHDGKKQRNSREQSGRYQNTDYFNLRQNREEERTRRKAYQTADRKKGVEPKQHSRKEWVYQEEQLGKKKSRLIHGDPEAEHGKTASAAAGAIAAGVKRKIRESDDGNSSVQGAMALEDGAELSYRLSKESARNRNRRKSNKVSRLQKRKELEELKKGEAQRDRSLLRKQIQKARIKREYAKAKRMDPSMQGTPIGTVDYIKKVGGKVTNFFKEHRKVYVSIGVLIALMLLIMASFTSCSVMFMNNVVDYSGFSYMSTDEAIRDADLYYTQLEANLQERINQIETENGGYDMYRYNIGPIGHDPFVLISYLSAKYGIFTFNNTIKAELDDLFARQYQLTTTSSTETITQTRNVRVGESLGAVVTSGYCNCTICCGQWSGGPTASGAYPTSNHTIAVDANNPVVPMGTKVVMNGVEYTVEDTGNFAQYGVAFDVYYDSHAAASNHGHQTWEAYLSDANGSQEIEVTTTSQQTVLSVSLTNSSLSVICQSKLNEEQKEWFNGYNHTKGNLQMFETPLDYNWYYMVSSYYGYRIHPVSGANQMHNGLDIAAPQGTPVLAGLTGRVTSATYNDSYGNYVVIENSDGYEIRYAHLNSISVSAGQSIEKSDEIGTIGSTGNSTGSHLHLELLHNGDRLNPIFYFETGEGSIYGDVEYSSEAAQRLCEFAVQFLGTPYVWGGYAPGGFDCSGFVSYCLTNSGVKNTGHLTTWGLYESLTIIPESEMQPGDIIFFQGTYNAPPPTHVAIYLGNGQMVHSGHPNQIASISDAYWQSHWYAVGRW